MLGAIAWSDLTIAAAFVVGWFAGSFVTLRILRAVEESRRPPHRPRRDRDVDVE